MQAMVVFQVARPDAPPDLFWIEGSMPPGRAEAERKIDAVLADWDVKDPTSLRRLLDATLTGRSLPAPTLVVEQEPNMVEASQQEPGSPVWSRAAQPTTLVGTALGPSPIVRMPAATAAPSPAAPATIAAPAALAAHAAPAGLASEASVASSSGASSATAADPARIPETVAPSTVAPVTSPAATSDRGRWKEGMLSPVQALKSIFTRGSSAPSQNEGRSSTSPPDRVAPAVEARAEPAAVTTIPQSVATIVPTAGGSSDSKSIGACAAVAPPRGKPLGKPLGSKVAAGKGRSGVKPFNGGKKRERTVDGIGAAVDAQRGADENIAALARNPAEPKPAEGSGTSADVAATEPAKRQRLQRARPFDNEPPAASNIHLQPIISVGEED